MHNILLIEDNELFSVEIYQKLKEEGYNVICAYDGEQALEIFERNNIDLVLLDIMLPKINGLVVLEEIRKKSDIPVIMLTSINHDAFQRQSFYLNVNDYIVKPCYSGILIKKINLALTENIKSVNRSLDNIWTYGEVRVDFSENVIIKNGEKIKLGKTPMEILKILVSNNKKILSRNQIIDCVWGRNEEVNYRTVDTHISKIKKALEIDCIQSISGYGYKLEY